MAERFNFQKPSRDVRRRLFCVETSSARSGWAQACSRSAVETTLSGAGDPVKKRCLTTVRLTIVPSEMAGTLNKSTKQILSVLFHLAVLGCMVLIYDAGKAMAVKLGIIEMAEKKAGEGDSSLVNFMEEEEVLDTTVDPSLAKLISKNEEGYLFRSDIPFPPHLKVIVTEVTKFKKVRIAKRVGAQTSQMELSSRSDKVMEYEMAGKAVRFTKVKEVNERKLPDWERLDRLKAIAEAEKNGTEPPEARDRVVDPLQGKAVQFNYKGKAWKAIPTKEFKTMAWGRGLEDEVENILMVNGLKPKPRWFGSKRIPIGHKVRLSGPSLDLFFVTAAKGHLDMEFKAVEGVHGHPCAVFEVTGATELKPGTDDEGRATSGEETIEKGRIWFSLLYPVVLRADLDMIVSYDTREKGKLVGQFQGKSTLRVHSDWKAVTKSRSEKRDPGKAK